MFTRWFNRFRKHSFDLDNPTIKKTMIKPAIWTGEGDIEFIYTQFHCIRCDKTFLLDGCEVNDLPRKMSHGCYPQGDN